MIVGRAVFPYFGQGSFTPTDLGEGAVVTAATLEPQAVGRQRRPDTTSCCCGSPRARAGRRTSPLPAGDGPFCATVEQPTCVVTDQRPNGVTNYARIDGTPEVLAGILAVLGLAVLGQFGRGLGAPAPP